MCLISQQVTQYHYIAWPDHGVPQTAYGLSQMLRAVIKHYGEGLHGPITVHCRSALQFCITILVDDTYGHIIKQSLILPRRNWSFVYETALLLVMKRVFAQCLKGSDEEVTKTTSSTAISHIFQYHTSSIFFFYIKRVLAKKKQK